MHEYFKLKNWKNSFLHFQICHLTVYGQFFGKTLHLFLFRFQFSIKESNFANIWIRKFSMNVLNIKLKCLRWNYNTPCMNISGVLICLFPWLTLPLPRPIFIIRTSFLFSLYSQFLLTNSILWGCSLNSDSHRNYKNIFLWAVWLRVTAKWPVRSNGLYYSRFSVCSCISNTRVIFRDTGSVPKEITFCQLTKWPVRSNSVYSSRFSVSSCILKYTSNILRHRKCSQGNNVL